MSHKIYTTEAIVCGGKSNNTSDKSFLLFTREAGMLWATARSVREERSKQRFALQDFSLARVSLIKGKSGWRIGSAESEKNYFTQSDTQPKRASVAKTVKLLRQFLQGEQPVPGIFDDTKKALELAGDADDIYQLRLLYRLGYIAATPSLEKYLEPTNWWESTSLPKEARVAIERAKEVSHL